MPHANLCNISTRCWQPQLKFESTSLGFFCWCFRQWSCVLNSSVLLWGNEWCTRPKIEAIRVGEDLSGFMAYFFDNAGFLPLKQCCQMCASCTHKWSFQRFFPRFLNADHHRKGILYLNFVASLLYFSFILKNFD